MKINKTFKKSISILLTVIMILSTFGAAIVPVGAADTTENTSSADTYYFWYGEGVNNIANWKNNIAMTANGDGTYYCDLLVNTGYELYFSINTNSSYSNDTSSTWNSGEVSQYVTCTSSVSKSSFSEKQYGANNYNSNYTSYYFPRISLSTSQNLRFTFTPSKTVVISVAGSTEETTAPTTTPSSSTWYVTGRFAINGGGHTGPNVGDWDATSKNIQLADTDGDGIYTIDTGYTEAELSNHSDWYIRLYDGTNQYGPSTDTPMDKGEKYSLTKNPNKSFQVVNKTGTTGTVKLCLDTINSKFYYTVDSGETSEEDGDYTIEDVTPVNGSLSFKAEGKTAGTADAGDTVTITVNPNTAFSLNEITAVYKDANGDEQELTVTDNQFTMPAFNVEVSATFTIDKDAYIADQGDGLWFDAAPSVTDTSATLVKWNNYTGSNHTTSGNPYTLYIPSDVSLSSVVLYNGYSSALTIADVTIPANDHATVSLAETTYTTSGATSKSVKVMHGSSSSMYFHTTKKGEDYSLPTATGAGSSKDDVKADGGTCVTIKDGTVSDSMVLTQVKGRGNSSWEASNEEFGKYAYNMKLDSATELFGLPKSKSYCLLANNADESMLRNALTYDLAKEIGLYDSPEFEFVDIYDNGEYHGTYFVCEKVDVAKKNKLIKGEAFDDINEKAVQTALNDSEAEVDENTNSGTYTYNGTQYDMQYCTVMDDTSSIPSSTEGTYLLEFEISSRYYNEASWFKSPKGQYVVVKSPEYATKEQVQYIAKKFAEMEAVVYSSSSTLANMTNYIDADSFAKMYLIQELSSNLDAAATSYYITVDCSGNTIENGVLTDNAKFVASPVWDYDWAYGQYQSDMYDSTKRYNYKHEEIKTDETGVWFAKEKSMDDSDNSNFIAKRNLQAELASHSAFQPVIKKVWNGTGLGVGNGFYDKVKYYYNTQIGAWHSQIADSMAMNEYRWKFIENNNIGSWGSADTGATLSLAVDFLEDWITDRSAWLNTQFASYSNYSQTVTPTLIAYTADGETELTGDVTQGTAYVLKATTTETYVTYKLYDGNTEVTSNTTGVFTISDATVGVHSYTVKTVTHSDNEMTSDEVEVNVLSTGSEPTEDKVAIPNVIGDDVDTATTKITDACLNTNVVYEYDDVVAENLVIRISPAVGTLMDKETTVTIYVSKGKEPVTEPSIPSGTVLTNVKIYFKGTNLKSLTPSLTINGTSYPLTRDTENGYIGTYYNGSYRFYWYTATIPQVTVGENYSVTIKTSGSLMNAVGTLTFATCNENNEIYLAVDNMQTGAAFEDITHNETAKVCFRSSANMITNVTNQFDPNKTLAKVMLTLLNADGTTTTSKYSIGDTNADGTVNIKDATVAQMMSANIVAENSTNSILGDYDVSGDVNVKDATGIQTYIVNC